MEKKNALLICSLVVGGLLLSACSSLISSSDAIATQVSEALEDALEETAQAASAATYTPYPTYTPLPTYTPVPKNFPQMSDRYYNNNVPPANNTRPGGMPPANSSSNPRPPMPRN